MSQAAETRDVPWQPLQRIALIAGAAGLAVWALGWGLAFAMDDPALHRRAFFAYLFAFGTCVGVPLGCLAIWMLHNQTGGAWGLAIRRVLEAAARTVPFMALLFLPIAFGLPQLYLWAGDHESLPDGHLKHLIEFRHAFSNPLAFLIRTAAYFAIWSFLAWRLDRWQVSLDRTWDPVQARRQQVFSGPGLVLYGLAVTFAAIDWYMSLEPEFFSTIFGVLVAMGQFVPALAFAVAFTSWLETRRAPGAGPIETEVRADLGSLLLAVVMLWAYISFSQFLLIWTGNLHEETVWYLRRAENGWQVIAIALAIFYFAVPFALLLTRTWKRDPHRLMAVAWLLVGVSVVHHFWLIIPAYASQASGALAQGMTMAGPLSVHWLDLAALVGVGGLSLAVFLWQLGRRPLTPPHSPYAEEVAHHA